MRLPDFATRWLLRRATRLIDSRPPDFLIGGDQPYLERWFVLPRNPICNLYLHRFLRDDDDRALHDHPWPSVSIILHNSYIEHTQSGDPTVRDRVAWRRAGSVIVRWAKTAHRISLPYNPWNCEKMTAISLFLTGPRIRRWGFHCPQGWVHWRVFVAPDDKGAIGRGCGER